MYEAVLDVFVFSAFDSLCFVVGEMGSWAETFVRERRGDEPDLHSATGCYIVMLLKTRPLQIVACNLVSPCIPHIS
jgi:hypothetical protein